MIELKELSRTFGQKQVVLHNVNYKFEEGKIYVIKGVSGCGKSTLLNIIAGLDCEYSGECFYNTQNIATMDSKKYKTYRKNVGYMFQSSLLIAHLTVVENLLFLCNDLEHIQEYANLFGVKHLLNKYPNELSGGERQRISAIRTILSNPGVIIADEPTAYLDYNNSLLLAKEMVKLKRQDNIILISTHEDCFDEVADVLIQMDYGTILDVQEKEQPIVESLQKNEPIHEKRQNKWDAIRKDLNYIKKKNHSKYKSTSVIALTFFLFIIFMMIGVYDNLSDIALQYYAKHYPMTSLELERSSYEKLKNEITFQVYESYYYLDNDVRLNVLPDYENSVFKTDGYILYGSFPTKESEVLVSQEYLKYKYSTDKYESYLGQTIELAHKKWIIKGVISDQLFEEDMFGGNTLYDRDGKNNVFIPYNAMKQIGEITDTYCVYVSADDLLTDSHVYTLLENQYEERGSGKRMGELKATLSMVWNLFLGIVIAILVVAILFIANNISLHLFYRKREFGYLQIFNLSKEHISRMIHLEYSSSMLRAIIYSIILFLISNVILIIGFNINIIPNLLYLLIVIVIALVYTWFVVSVPTRNFLKKDILSLIK